MRTTLPLVLACLAPLSHAIKLEQSDSPAVVGTTIQRRRDASRTPDRLLARRQDVNGTVYLDLDNEQTLYFADVSIGDPAQQFRLHVDTGSSDLWVNAAESQLCQSSGDYCSTSGTYAANSSSSYQYVNSAFNISYQDGSSALGEYVSDSVSIGNLTVPRLQFGVGYDSTSPQGILGLGYTQGTVQVLRAGLDSYNNLPAALVKQGAIRTNAYSLWLNDLDASMGSILFGGVDSQKYTDPLLSVPIIPQFGTYLRFIIALTALGTNGDLTSLGNNINAPVLLDSGSSITYLPDSIVNTLYQTYSVQYNSNYGIGIVDCALANDPGTLDFTFSGATIRVPLNELVVVNGVRRNGESVCIFGVSPNQGSTPILGDTFLRSAYVVYDLEAHEISLAQTDFNATSSNVMEIMPANAGGVPGATLVPSPVTAVSGIETGAGRIDTIQSINAAAAITPAPRVWGAAAGAVAMAGGALWAL